MGGPQRGGSKTGRVKRSQGTVENLTPPNCPLVAKLLNVGILMMVDHIKIGFGWISRAKIPSAAVFVLFRRRVYKSSFGWLVREFMNGGFMLGHVWQPIFASWKAGASGLTTL